MAGHNKWSKVKHIKARVDAIKGRVFSKCAHEIALAARAGGGDPAANARLRTAIDNAKAVSMPKDNIDRAIRKGTGELGGEAIQEVAYEGYGPAGIAFIVEMATDNLNRSAADIRSIFTKNGGSVATQGSVSYQFDRKGEIRIPADAIDEERLMETAIEAGADDVESDEDEHILFTAPNELGTVANAPASRRTARRLGKTRLHFPKPLRGHRSRHRPPGPQTSRPTRRLPRHRERLHQLRGGRRNPRSTRPVSPAPHTHSHRFPDER
jgi:YebC/PmpR family DNA-binding regulatory protein